MPIALLPPPAAFQFGAQRFSCTQEWRIEWSLRRHSAWAMGQLTAVCVVLGLLSWVGVSLVGMQGAHGLTYLAWLGVLSVVVAVAFDMQHAADRERITLTPDCLWVEHHCGWHTEHAMFHPRWVRVEPVTNARSLIALSGRGRLMAVGRYVRPEWRQCLAQEIRQAVRQAVAVSARVHCYHQDEKRDKDDEGHSSI